MNDPTMTGGEGTPVAGSEGYYDDNGQFVLGSAATSGKGKRNGLTKTGKPRKQWTKKGDKPDPNKRIADSLKRMEGSPMIGTPELGTATVNSEVGSSPAPMPDLDDAAVGCGRDYPTFFPAGKRVSLMLIPSEGRTEMSLPFNPYPRIPIIVCSDIQR